MITMLRARPKLPLRRDIVAFRERILSFADFPVAATWDAGAVLHARPSFIRSSKAFLEAAGFDVKKEVKDIVAVRAGQGLTLTIVEMTKEET
jgi:hypothetical protein